jgi:hypothetical protein
MQHKLGIPELQQLAGGGVGCSSEVVNCFEELFALADKEPIGGEACDRSQGSSKRIGQRTNDRALGEFGIEEFARDGKDQARLNQAGRLQRWVGEKIWKRQALVRHRCYRGLHGITRKINPLQEVSDLVPTDAKGDLNYLPMLRFLIHGCIKTRATLLNVSEVKGSYIRDHLNMIGIVEISVGDRNGGTVRDFDRLRKRGAKVWIGCTAVANEPAGVDVEVHEVRQAPDVLRSRSCASL